MQQTLQLIHPQTFFKILLCRYLQKSQQNQAKSQIPLLQTTYRTQYRQIPLKSSISATSQPKNQTLIPPKIYQQIQNLPYLQALLPITFFHLKIAKIISHHIQHTVGYHKTTRKTIKTVIALSYFYAKNKIKQRIYNQEFINRI